ncbi:MAG: DUF4405 domain-containing protein [Eubacteriales bacterium]|nr:DUF4405 domain-containing protein [Eubacteriales bacterium]
METQSKQHPNAKQVRILKLLLDAVMLVLLVLMYKKQVISMAFHEIGGLALIGLFLIHHLVNAKWIGAATRRLFTRNTPGLVRARYIVDALLLLAFLAIGVTGVLISKVVFSLRVAGNFKALHYFASAFAILLMGVHLGLHAEYIFGKLVKKSASKVAKIALCVVLAALIAFGGYSLFATSFLSYLAAPLQAASFSHGNFQPNGEIALDGSAGDRPTDLSELPEASAGNDAQPPQGGENGAFGGREEREEGGSVNAALLIAQYIGIISLFGAATYGILRLTGRRKQVMTNQANRTDEDALPDENL